MKSTLRTIILVLLMPLLLSCGGSVSSHIVSIRDAKFYDGENPYYFIGTNFWYGAILASDGQGGDKARLAKELDSLKALGVTNLRVLVGGDGPDGVPTRIEPTLQKEPGVYNEDIFKGLDNLLVELGKRDMKAVLYVNNSWEWSGGYGMYLEWAGQGKAIIPSIEGYGPFMQQMASFATCREAQELFFNHLRTVVSRVNSLTGKPYSEDPAIFSWQIGNEPRCFSGDPAVKDAFVGWLTEAASIIKSIDPNHMVSTGSEGSWGCENDMDLYRRIHSCPDIDYLTMHIWPYNWSWVDGEHPQNGIDNAEAETKKYMAEHIAVAESLSKPLVLEEFGFPRDDFRFSMDAPTTGRDRYFRTVFGEVISSARKGGVFAGVNFWGWGGYGVPSHENWQKGDDYTGDPAQEAQGLNSVFATDKSTVSIIREAAASLSAPAHAEAVLENDWMFSQDNPLPLRVAVVPQGDFRGKLDVSLDIRTDKGENYSFLTKKADLSKGVDTLSFDLGLKEGFYRVRIVSEGQNPDDNSFVVGCDPEKISSPMDRQEDFLSFWEKGLSELAGVPVNSKMTLDPSRSDSFRNTYIVRMDSFGGKRISGILLMPVKSGKYPVKITYMGYGAEPWYPDPSSEPELIDFTLCVRDQGLDKTPAAGWVKQGLSSPYTYYYKGAYLDCVRAVDFVCSLPNADTSRILAEGGSQGGAFTLVAASLDHRIKAIAPFVPFMSDFPDYFAVAQWPANEILPEAEALGIKREDLLRTLSYFDVKNFTSMIECPVLMGFGLQDDVCPPHTNFSGYNMITTSKRWVCFPLSGHHVEEDQRWWQERNAFFAPFLGQGSK